MNRRTALNFSSFLFIFLFFSPLFISCGNSQRAGDSFNSLGAVPTKWSKYLAAGSVSATLDVYRNNGKHELTEALNVDLTNGVVTADPFSLPTGDTYRFLITFYYTLSNGDSIPYAYADFRALIDELSEQVRFSENDIRYSYDTSNPEVTASISDGVLPNLDDDSDGWNNWEELRDKANPQDGNSIPQNPQVTVSGKQDSGANTATITVTATDNARVEDLRLIDPICGVTTLGDSSTNNSDGSVTRTLRVRLDLLSVGANPRLLQALASDGVTQSQNANSSLDFSISGNSSQPYFVFTDPPINGELEGPIVFKGVACSRNNINVSSIKFLNQEIDQFGFTGARNEQTGDFHVQSTAVDTTLLPDGKTTLNIELQDISSKKGNGSGDFEVVNDSPIKMITMRFILIFIPISFLFA